MLDPGWVFAGATLGLIGSLRYAVATISGRTRPNVVTWSLWASAPLIGFGAQIEAGVGLPAVMTLAAGLGPTIVLVAALASRHTSAHLAAFDYCCAALSMLALGVWLGLGHAPMAVLFAVATDAIAAGPTIAKAWKLPDSENAVFYALVAVGAVITLLTVTSAQVHIWAFAAYQAAICLLLITIIVTRRRQRSRH